MPILARLSAWWKARRRKPLDQLLSVQFDDEEVRVVAHGRWTRHGTGPSEGRIAASKKDSTALRMRPTWLILTAACAGLMSTLFEQPDHSGGRSREVARVNYKCMMWPLLSKRGVYVC